MQTLDWVGGTGMSAPYLVVSDSSSGRQLKFYRDGTGYITRVVAPALDGWGRLKSIVGGGVNITYTYDGAGRLLSRTSGGVTTYFLYDGGMLLAELGSDGALQTGYVWGVNGLICQHTEMAEMEDPFGFGGGNGTESLGGGWELLLWISLYYLFDGFGNTEGLTDAGGEIVAEEEYGSWGSAMYQEGAATGFGYSGQWGGWSEGNSGIVFSNHAAPSVYVPAAGQFAQSSGVGYGGGNHPYLGYGGDPNDVPMDEEELGSLGALYGSAGRRGWAGLKAMPEWQPGSEGRRFFSDVASLAPPYALYTTLSGQDPIGGGKASTFQRALGLLGPLKVAGRAAGKALAPVGSWIGGMGRAAWEKGMRVYDWVKRRGGCFSAETKVQVAVPAPKQTGPRLRQGKASKQGNHAGVSKGRARVARTQGSSLSSSSVAGYVLVSKPIAQVQQDDLVVAKNEQTGEVSLKRVLQTSVREVDLTLVVTLSDAATGKTVEVLTTTREHPFYVEGQGFVPAGGLAIGNQIVTRAGPSLVVSRLEWRRHTEGVAVYNFEVEGDHTYFVGSANGGVWN